MYQMQVFMNRFIKMEDTNEKRNGSNQLQK